MEERMAEESSVCKSAGLRAVPSEKLAGDFEKKFAQYLPAALRTARRLYGGLSEDQVKDIVADATFKVWLKWFSDSDSIGGFSSYLRAAVKHKGVDHFRRSRGHLSTDMPLFHLEPCYEMTISSGLLELIKRLLDELHQGHVHIFQLYYIDGYSYEEIAQRLELPVGTVKSRLHRVVTHLRKRLSAQGYTRDSFL
jgi:RNA polymerase sigma-70 factor, ECF subfamily